MKIKLQDFARECGVTDRAIQKHIQKHEEALRGHFERKGPNGTWLDDYAQEYIRNLMVQPAPAVISDARLTQENSALQQQKLFLDEKVASQQELIDKLLAEIGQLNNTIGRLQASEDAHRLLTEGAQAEAARATQRAESAEQRADKAHQEAKEARESRDKETARASALEVELTRQKAREDALMKRSLLDRIRNVGV